MTITAQSGEKTKLCSSDVLYTNEIKLVSIQTRLLYIKMLIITQRATTKKITLKT